MTIIVYDDIYLEHGSPSHVESPARLTVTTEYLQKMGEWQNVVEPRAATLDEIRMVHEERMIEFARKTSEAGGGFLDPDTQVSARSYEAALYAAGGVLTVIDKIMDGADKNALCLVRPPGHHATPTRSMGFCVFNNLAIGVRYLQKKYGVERIGIVDWDAHHGNGLQETFYADPGVMYCSAHCDILFPGTGHAEETGEGEAEGTTRNYPTGYRTRGDEFVGLIRDAVEGPLAEFKPEFVLISAGFDALADDPLCRFCLKPEDFGTMTRMVCDLAAKHSQGRVVSTLEGGYSLELLPKCIQLHLAAMRDYCS